MKEKKKDTKRDLTADNQLPKYQTPEVTTLTEAEVIEELGPARACEYGGTRGC